MRKEINQEVIRDNIREAAYGLPLSYYKKGCSWYIEAHEWCRSVAEDWSLPIEKVIGITCAMSVSNSWGNNKVCVVDYLRGISKHTRIQIEKCNRIMKGEDPTVALGGRKTIAFYDCLLKPLETKRVVIDRHMLNISNTGMIDCTPKQYDIIESIWVDVSKEVSLRPVALQASIWSWWRDVNNKSRYG